VAERYKVRFCRRSLEGTASSNPTGSTLVRVVYRQVEALVANRFHVQRSPFDCGVSLCETQKASRMRKLWSALGYCARGKKWYEYFTFTCYGASLVMGRWLKPVNVQQPEVWRSQTLTSTMREDQFGDVQVKKKCTLLWRRADSQITCRITCLYPRNAVT
jgi:hypothetical protein